MSERVEGKHFPKTAEFVAAAREDFKSSPRRYAVGAVATGVAFLAHEAGMEAVLAQVGGHTLDATKNSLLSIPAVAVANGGVSFGVEWALTRRFARLFQRTPKASAVVATMFEAQASEGDGTKTTVQKAKDASLTGLTAVMLGSPGVLLTEFPDHPERSYEDNVKRGNRIARGLGAMNAALAAGVAGAGLAANSVWPDAQHHISRALDGSARVAGVPVSYGYLALVAGLVGSRLHGLAKRGQSQETIPQPAVFSEMPSAIWAESDFIPIENVTPAVDFLGGDAA